MSHETASAGVDERLVLETAMLVIHVVFFDWGHVATNLVLILITTTVFMQRAQEASAD